MAGDALTRMEDEARGGAKVMMAASEAIATGGRPAGESEARGCDGIEIGPVWGQSFQSRKRRGRGRWSAVVVREKDKVGGQPGLCSLEVAASFFCSIRKTKR